MDEYVFNLEDNIELRKAIAKLEDIIQKKYNENDNLLKIYEDMKLLNEKIKKELFELNEKYLNLIDEKKKTDIIHKEEIEKLKEFYERLKLDYEAKLLKLNSYGNVTYKNKIISEVELKFKTTLGQKDDELNLVNEEILQQRKKYENLLIEFENYKTENKRDMTIMTNKYKDEINELNMTNKVLKMKLDESTSKNNLINLNEIDDYRKNTLDLQNKITYLLKEKDNILYSKNELKLSFLREMEQQNLKFRLIEGECERLNQINKNMDYEINSLKSELNDKIYEIKIILSERYNLLYELKEKEKDHELFKKEIIELRNKVEEGEKEIDIQSYQINRKECENLINQIRDNDKNRFFTDDIKSIIKQKDDNFQVYSSDNNGQNGNKIQILNEIEMLVNENNKLKESIIDLKIEISKYKQLEKEYNEQETILKSRNEEITNLKNIINKSGINMTFDEYTIKINEMKNKKNYYKQQCILHNNRLQRILTSISERENTSLVDLNNDI